MGDKRAHARPLRFSDDAMFKRVMKNKRICKGVIGRIIGRKVDEVAYTVTQHEQLAGPEAKEARMDAFVVESGGAVFDVEMQVRKSRLLPLRFRAYQALLDANRLRPGRGYDQLRESYIIFICTHDPFGFGRPVYTIGPVCAEEACLDFDCRARWMVLNAKAWDMLPEGDGLRELLRYVQTNQVPVGDELIGMIDAEVCYYNGKGRYAMLVDSITAARWDGHAEGLEEGLEKGEAKGLQKGMRQGLEQGLEQGQDRYARLVDALMDAGRLDDLRAANTDPRARERLFAEFGI